MSRLTIYFSVIFLQYYSTYSQTQNTVKGDFNKDGITDQIKVTDEDMVEKFIPRAILVQYIDGKTKTKYRLNMIYSSGSFFSVCSIPNALNKPAREAIGKLFFAWKDSIDPSLNWLIDFSSSRGAKYNPIWISGEPELPDGYDAILKTKNYKPFLETLARYSSSSKIESDYFWVDYHTYPGHRFNERKRGDTTTIGTFKVSKIDSTTWIYNTANAVILKKGNKYSWVFISDNQVIQANETFKWTSIRDVQMINEYVLVLHTPTGVTNFLYIINPVTGYITHLDGSEMGINIIESMKVYKETVELNGMDGEKYLLGLDRINELFKEISRETM